jgi:hypothetical protein
MLLADEMMKLSPTWHLTDGVTIVIRRLFPGKGQTIFFSKESF